MWQPHSQKIEERDEEDALPETSHLLISSRPANHDKPLVQSPQPAVRDTAATEQKAVEKAAAGRKAAARKRTASKAVQERKAAKQKKDAKRSRSFRSGDEPFRPYWHNYTSRSLSNIKA